MADGTRYSAGGAVSLTARRNVALGRIEASAISVTAATGVISDITAAEGPGNENLVAGDLGLTAATGIGAPGGSGDIDTAADTINARTARSGGIYLDETDAVTLASTAHRGRSDPVGRAGSAANQERRPRDPGPARRSGDRHAG